MLSLEGKNSDQKKFLNIVRYISQYNRLHGLCFLMKYNQNRVTPYFESWFQSLFYLFALGVVFAFTFSRGCRFTDAPAVRVFNSYLNVIKADMQLTQDITYYFDNDAFEFLTKIYNKQYDNDLTDKNYDNYCFNWKISSQSTVRMKRKPYNT
jgi:hypothetical protein